MDRVLRHCDRWVHIVAEGPNESPPLRIRVAQRDQYQSPVSSAQVKSSALFAGLFAKGKTTVNEPSASRNHTVVVLFLIRTVKKKTGITVFGDQVPSRGTSPSGDISSAAFWLVAAAASQVAICSCGKVVLNDTRTALRGVLIRMGRRARGRRRCGTTRTPRHS
jgi:3-phosphoshikimate 1-carboxyvinyltransferase